MADPPIDAQILERHRKTNTVSVKFEKKKQA